MSDSIENIGDQLEAAGVTNDRIEKMLKGDEAAELSAADYMHIIELTMSAMEQTNDVLDDNMRDIDKANNEANGTKGLYFSNLLHDSLMEFYLFMVLANCTIDEYTVKGINSLMKVFLEEYTEADIRKMIAEKFKIYNPEHKEVKVEMAADDVKLMVLGTFVHNQRYDIIGELLKAAEFYDEEEIINDINAIISMLSMMMSVVTIAGHTNLFGISFVQLLQKIHERVNEAYPDSVASENINNLKAAQMRFKEV